ncbi:uncharacterized protein TRIADDRAFT_27180, partial [Trichoplax adhaerens]
YFRNLGKSGLRVSALGFGTWVTFGSQVSDKHAEELITVAYENGINFFDTAEVYAGGKAEIVLGQVLRKKQWRRSTLVISTKIFWGGRGENEQGLSRKHIIEGLKASLHRLQLEYVDIVFANRPDSTTPMEEIVRAFTFVINQGLAFYWGVSQWTEADVMEAYAVARQYNLIPPTAIQAEYHFMCREQMEAVKKNLYDKCGVGAVTWSPLAGGVLSGKYMDDTIPEDSRASLSNFDWWREKIQSEEGRRMQAKLKELQIIADRIDCTLCQLAIAWCLKNDRANCVLLGAKNSHQLKENITAIAILPKLDHSMMHSIDEILGNKPIVSKAFRK